MFSKKKRKTKRIHLVYYLLVFDRETDDLVGHVVDITTGGMKLMGTKALRPDTIYHLRMLLPDDAGGSRPVNLDARCIWLTQNMFSDFWGTGFAFTGIPDDDIAAISGLIDKFGY